jgi:hypothetical protein
MKKTPAPAPSNKASKKNLHLCFAQKAYLLTLFDLSLICWAIDYNFAAFLTVISTFSYL